MSTIDERLSRLRAKRSAEAESVAREQEAQSRCNEWLVYCLVIGWSGPDLKELERFWWRYHGRSGWLRREKIS